MIDLSNLSIIITFRYDTEDRLTNLKTVFRYFKKYFIDYEIIVLESDTQPRAKNACDDNAKYIYEYSDSYMHRTRMFNDGVRTSERKYVALYDTDVFVKPEAMQIALEKLNTNVFVFPYNGVFLNMEGKTKNRFIDEIEFSELPMVNKASANDQYSDDIHCVHPMSAGGVTIFRRKEYLMYGGYNERFKSWGWEDNEIIERFTKLGFPPFRLDGYNLYHLDHRRGVDSGPTHNYFRKNKIEFNKVRRMNKRKLEKYIQQKLMKQEFKFTDFFKNLLRKKPDTYTK